MSRSLLALAFVVGCGDPPPGNNPNAGTPVGTGTPAGSPTTGEPATGTPTTGTPGGSITATGPIVRSVDCNQLLPLPLAFETHTWVPSHEDFTFSVDHRWIGTTGGHLKATPWGGPSVTVVPGTGDARGTRFLPDGSLVLAVVDTGTVIRVDPSGSTSMVASGLTNPNGIAIGWDGKVYVATTGEILRLDAYTGDRETVASMPGHSFDGLTFTPDYRRLYFNEEIGRLNYVDFDENGVPGEATFYLDLPISPFTLLDGMTMDACGNLYAVEMGGKLWRVSPAGDVELAADFPVGAFVPAVNFPPLGGADFDENSVYVQDFIGRMYAIPVGVPGKWEPHHPQ